MITRREFGKYIGRGALVLGVGEVSMGFSCGSVFTDIATYVPIAISAFDAVLEIISPSEAALLAPIIKDVKSGFADLVSIVTSYNNAPATDKATWLGKIKTAINAVMAYLQQFWNDVNLPNGTLASTIEGVLQVIISTLAAFLPLIGGTVLVAKVKNDKGKSPIKVVPYSKNQLKQAAFKKNVNNVFASNGYPNRVQ